MTQIGSAYAQALYSLAKDEGLTKTIFSQLSALDDAFCQEPAYFTLLGSPNLTKQEKCALLDESFQNTLHPYVLNFLKLLTEKGYAKEFPACYRAYMAQYHEDHNILSVTAVTAVALTQQQSHKLAEKLKQLTGKDILLSNRVNPQVLGGVQLSYDGKRLEDTVSSRLEAIAKQLSSTVL